MKNFHRKYKERRESGFQENFMRENKKIEREVLRNHREEKQKFNQSERERDEQRQNSEN